MGRRIIYLVGCVLLVAGAERPAHRDGRAFQARTERVDDRGSRAARGVRADDDRRGDQHRGL